MRKYFYAAALILMTSALASRASSDAKDLNAKVLEFCEKHNGEEVGSGQCAELAAHALKAAGARVRGKDSPGDGDYVWGKEVFLLEHGTSGPKATGEYSAIKAGDIIQMRDVEFHGKNKGKSYTEMSPHHTVVVKSVSAGGHELKILEQNSNGRKTVAEAALHLDDLKKGWIRVYEPVAEHKK